MKVKINQNELARKRSDYKFGYKQADGKIGYHDCDYKSDPDQRLPFRKAELAEMAGSKTNNRTYGEGCGWQIFPRYSYGVELLESYRVGKKNLNRFYWSATFNPNPSTKGYEKKGVVIKRRFDFWKRLERQLIKHKVAPDNADRIRNQVAEVIPLVTKEELATMEANLKQIKANNREDNQMM
jgi:hypothetical protein